MTTGTSAPVNPHLGLPFTESDGELAAYLADVSIPALLCSLVHLTGDPSWIRGPIRPGLAALNEYQGFLPADQQEQVRVAALPALIAYRDGGCVAPPPPSAEIVREMMDFLGGAPVDDSVAPLFVEDLQLDGRASIDLSWARDLTPDQRAQATTLVIGCGEAGLLAGIWLQELGLPYVIIEKNAGPGGTWWENSYPGARVDVGSHFYCYASEPADHWTEYFSQQPELQAYFDRVMRKHGVEANCRFGTEVVAATWDEAAAEWAVEVRTPAGDVEIHRARAVISAVGSLNQPLIPDIPGLGEFAGPSFHSARWDHSVDHRGTRFALIGAGASGFQIAPTIAPDVDHLTVFQRTAQWMFPNANYHRAVPPGENWAMLHLPYYARWFRFLTFWPAAGLSLERSRRDPEWDDSDGLAISESNLATRQMFSQWIISQVGDDPDLLAKVLPDYPATGKRTLQDNGSWLSCLRRDNVDLIRTGIDHIDASGIVTDDGVHHEADVICFATGFRHNDFLWPMTIVGRSGRSLRETWGDQPSAYLGITVPDFPNLFCVYGPGTNLAHGGSLIFQSECQLTYILDGIRQLVTGGHRSLEPTRRAHDDYQERYRGEIDQMVWSHWAVRHSHYKNPEGAIHTLSPWPIPEYWAWTQHLDPTDYAWS